MLVVPGVYLKNVNFNGHNIVLGSLFITNRDTVYIDSTVIDGNQNGSVVTIRDEENEGTELIGFTITNGSGTVGHGGDTFGGGVLCNDANLTISHCTISWNSTSGDFCEGGGIWGSSSNLTLKNVKIIHNQSVYGGGIRFGIGNHTLSGVTIAFNTAIRGGGGIRGMGIHAVFENCRISNNTIVEIDERIGGSGGCLDFFRNSEIYFRDVIIENNVTETGSGAGIYTWRTSIIMYNCLIYNNQSFGAGAAISLRDSDLILFNSTIANCSPYGLFCRDNGVDIVNCIFLDNGTAQVGIADSEVSFLYSNIEDGEDGLIPDGVDVEWLEGNIDTDPLFIDAENGDYHLTADSPCIDTGNPEADLDPDGTRADMGAYYFHQLDIDVNPINIEFPAIEWGEWDSTAVNITNTGGTDLSIIEILYSLHVTHVFLQYVDPDELPIVIQPQDTLTLYACNHPDPRAMRQSGVTIVSDDPDEPEIEIQMIAEVLSVGDEPSYPDRYSLSTPYPNPFNSTVTLDYNLSTSAQTSILVYDLSGRALSTVRFQPAVTLSVGQRKVLHRRCIL